MNLFNTVIPYPDEAIMSFYDRMAYRNGFPDLDTFYRIVVSPEGSSLFSGYGNTFSGDPSGIRERLDRTSICLPESHPLSHNPKAFYMNHTLFPLYSMFFNSEKEKTDYIDHECFGKEHTTRHWIPWQTFPVNSQFCFCRKCFNEDKDKYGTAYIHRSHQIPGVYVCPVHNEPLCCSVVSNTGMITFKDMKTVDGYKNVDPGMAFQYARMCKDFLESPVNTTAINIEETISNTMKSLPYLIWSYYSSEEHRQYDYLKKQNDKERISFLSHAAEDTGLIFGVNGYLKKAYLRGGGSDIPEYYACNDYHTDGNRALVMLFMLFRTADFAKDMINKKGHMGNEDRAQVIVNLLTNDYTVENTEKAPYNTYVTLAHQSCGNTFKASLRGFMNGDRCPCCSGKADTEDCLLRETGWIVQKKATGGFWLRGNRLVDMTEKQILQEVYRPFLSPVIQLTRKERILAHADYRAGEIRKADDKRILAALEQGKGSLVFQTLDEMYPDEDIETIGSLAEHYKKYLNGRKFSYERSWWND